MSNSVTVPINLGRLGMHCGIPGPGPPDSESVRHSAPKRMESGLTAQVAEETLGRWLPLRKTYRLRQCVRLGQLEQCSLTIFRVAGSRRGCCSKGEPCLEFSDSGNCSQEGEFSPPLALLQWHVHSDRPPVRYCCVISARSDELCSCTFSSII
jgi:hypothetical protein